MTEPRPTPGPAPAADDEQTEEPGTLPGAGGISIVDSVGGPLGIAEATLPFIAFSIAWTASGNDVGFGAIVAVSISAVLAGFRLLRRESLQYAFSGLLGVALGAFVASRTGEASDFFLPGMIIQACFLVAYVVSILVSRPLLGLVLAQFTGEGKAWYEDPVHRRLYTKASWIWAGIFATRLAIQVPLFVTDSVGALAAARVATGAPLFALGIWLSYLILRPILAETGALSGGRMPGPGAG